MADETTETTTETVTTVENEPGDAGAKEAVLEGQPQPRTRAAQRVAADRARKRAAQEAAQSAATQDASEDDESSDEEQKDEPAANIKFVGKDREQYGKTISARPFTVIHNGLETIKLPETETEQRAGFFHEKAETIVTLFPKLYKHYTPKA